MQDATPKILIVEDEPPLAELEGMALEGAGYAIEVVGRGDRGLEFLEEGGVSLVLLDYKLPDMTGDEFLDAMGERVRTLPVVVVTGNVDTRVAIRMLKAGAAEYVMKDTELVFRSSCPRRYRTPSSATTSGPEPGGQGGDREAGGGSAGAGEGARGSQGRGDPGESGESEFLANLSHEVRTPMTAIFGFVDLLLDDDYIRGAPPARLEDLLAIQDNGAYLLELLDDIFDLSIIETGRLAVAHRRFDLRELLGDLISQMRVPAEKKGLELSWRAPARCRRRSRRIRCGCGRS